MQVERPHPLEEGKDGLMVSISWSELPASGEKLEPIVKVDDEVPQILAKLFFARTIHLL